MIKSLWWSFKRNIEGPLLTLVAALILCAIIGVPAALLSWGFCSLPEGIQLGIGAGLLVLFVGMVVGSVVHSLVKFCRRVWRDAKEHREWLNSHSSID
jgi:predicted PurR-regulated permease PerM